MSSSKAAEATRPLARLTDRSTLLLGLGNPILRDDGVGWQVAAEAERLWQARTGADATQRAVEFDCCAASGLALMERLAGYRRAILVDAIQTPGGRPGAVYRLALDDLPTRHADSAHDVTLAGALALGRRLGASLPDEIVIYAIEAIDVEEFGEELTPQVAAAVRPAAEALLQEISPL